MTEERRLDTEGTSEIVCPHCGDTSTYYADVFRSGELEAVIDCGACGKMFHVEMCESVTYTTTKIEEGGK